MKNKIDTKQQEIIETKKDKVKSWEFNPKLVGDYEWSEVTSALQKSIRRGKERDAVYWASILFKSGFSNYLKRRLAVIINEDIGPANPSALILAGLLRLDSITKKVDPKYERQEFNGDAFLPICNLIIIACRGRKSRIGDELTNLIFDTIDKEKKFLSIPDYAIDSHTKRGREILGYWEEGTKEQSHKRIRLWFDEHSKLENEDEQYNTYREELKDFWGYYDASKAPTKTSQPLENL